MFTFYVRDANGEILAVYNYGEHIDSVWTEAFGWQYFTGYNLNLANWYIYGSGSQGNFCEWKPDTAYEYSNSFITPQTYHWRSLGNKEYGFKDHLGDVRAVFSDMKTVIPATGDHYSQIRSLANYYPFGMMQPGRQWAADSSLFGYNGKEKMDKIAGRGNDYDYGERMYDTRSGRFWSLDPMSRTFPQHSPFLYAYNNPISAIDLNGTTSFFIMGTMENLEETKNVRLRESIDYLSQTLSTSTGKVNYGFDWSDLNGYDNNLKDRKIAAKRLADYVVANNKPGDDITLIGYSYGVGVLSQAATDVGLRLKTKVNVISIAAPADNEKGILSNDKDGLMIYQNSSEISENPEYIPFINDMIHLWLDDDGVAGGLAGDDFYNSKKVRNYMIDDGGKNWVFPSGYNAHGFIFYPEMIKKTVETQKIPPLKSINEGKNETKDK